MKKQIQQKVVKMKIHFTKNIQKHGTNKFAKYYCNVETNEKYLTQKEKLMDKEIYIKKKTEFSKTGIVQTYTLDELTSTFVYLYKNFFKYLKATKYGNKSF